MTNIVFTDKAADFLKRRLLEASILRGKPPGVIPQLAWSVRTTFTGLDGKSEEYGPRFYLSWVTPQDAEENTYVIADVPGIGKLALAPGDLFRSDQHLIDVNNDHLVLS